MNRADSVSSLRNAQPFTAQVGLEVPEDITRGFKGCLPDELAHEGRLLRSGPAGALGENPFLFRGEPDGQDGGLGISSECQAAPRARPGKCGA